MVTADRNVKQYQVMYRKTADILLKVLVQDCLRPVLASQICAESLLAPMHPALFVSIENSIVPGAVSDQY